MYHLKPSSKGDPLCPLGFHPQVRWPTRCKRCFRDYKEHGNKKDPPQLRKDEFAFSTPALSSASPFSRSRTEDILQDNTLGTRSWTSSSNLSTIGSPPSTHISDQLGERGSSWTSSPNLAEGNNEDVTVNIVIPRRRRPNLPQHQQAEVEESKADRWRNTDYSSSRTDSLGREYGSSRTESSTKDYSSSRLDSSKSYSSSRTDSSAKDYGFNRSDSRDYSSSRTDTSTKDYGYNRSNSRDYSSSRTDTSTKDYGYSRSDSRDYSSSRSLSKDRRQESRIETKPDSRTESLLNSSANKNDVDFIFHVKSLSGQKGGQDSNRSSRRGSSSSDDAPTVTTDTTLVNMRENQLLEEIESLKKELDTVKTRCEKAEREKSDLMLRRLATIETTTSKSESLKLQQKVNELKSQVEDMRDEKRSLTLKVREVEGELDLIKSTGAHREVEQLRNKMEKAEQLIEQLMEENQDLRREIRDMEEEMLEMQDTFREDQADEYSSLKKELEQATKKCRILTFKLKKSERKTEQLDAEKLDMERKMREVAGGQVGLDKAEKIRKLEHELKISNEAALRLQKDLDDAKGRLKEGTQTAVKKKTPLLGSIPKTPSGEKVSRLSLVRGGSQEDPAQLLRDLQDSLEREADLREQLKHAEEEVEIFRKKASRVEEDNESLVMQLKKMATKAKSKRLSPSTNRLNPEEKDEGISDEDDPAELRIQLELNEQEACVLRRKIEALESERDTLNKKNKDLQDKLTAKLSTAAKQQSLNTPTDSNTIYQHKIKVMETETSELRLKLIEKERECERLHAEISLSNKKPKLLQKSKSLDGDQAAVDMKRQVQVIESEAAILRTKIQDLESDNEKLLIENKRLIMLKGARRAGSVEKSEEPKPLVLAMLEKQLEDANKKIKDLEIEKEKKKDDTVEAPSVNTEELDKVKLQLKKVETAKKKLEESIERIRQESSLTTIEFFNKRKPRLPTLQTTKQQMKKWIEDSENDIHELLVSLKKNQQEKPDLAKAAADKTALANLEAEKKKLENELKTIKEQSDKKDKELDDIKSQIKNYELEKTKLKKETDSSKTLWEKDKAKLTAAKEDLDKKKLQLDKQVTDLNNEIKTLKKSNEEIAVLKKKIDTLNKSLEDEKKQSEDIKKQVKDSGEAEEEKKKLLKQIETKNNQVTELEKTTKELEEKLKKIEKLNATKKEKLSKIEKEKAEKEKKLEEVVKSVESLNDEKNELATKLEEQEAKVKQLKNELDRKKKAIEELEKTGKEGKGVPPNTDELRRLRDELDTKQSSLEELENKLKKVNKERDDFQQKFEVKEKDFKKELEYWEKKLSDLENDLQSERKVMERLKAAQELDMKTKEQEIAQLQTKNLTAGTKKMNDIKHEMQAKIERLEMALQSEKKEYDELTGKYEELEEEHVVTKAQLVKEKEAIHSQLVSTEEELKRSSAELRTLRESINSKQDGLLKEKMSLQEKVQDLGKKSEKHALESQKFEAMLKGKQQDIDIFKKETNDLVDQNDKLRRDNEELKRQMDDFDKVVKVQRSMNADADALEKEIKEYKTRLVMEEKSRKKELAAQKARYDNRVSVLSNELLGAQGQVARFKKERDSYKKILDETQRQIDRGQPSANRLSFDGENAMAQLEQQVGCLEEELSEARLEASRIKTEFLSDKSAWQLKQSELTSKLNEMEEEKVLLGGRTKVTGVRTRMELAWQKEREDQQRLLQETSTLARDLRQTLFEVERERDRERLESKRRLEQVKRNSEEEQEDLKKKVHDMQCDILELRDAHAKIRTTNEKLRRERDKWERDRDAVRHMMSERKKLEQEDERKIISVAQLVEELTNLAPGLFPTKPRPLGVAPTPPLRRKSKSRETSPLPERRDLSRESSVGKDEVAKTHEMSEILLRLSEAAQQLKKHSSDSERARRSMSMRAGSTDSDSGIEPLSVRSRSGNQRNSNLRKSYSLEQTQQEQQAIWRQDSDSREGSVQSIDDETYQRIYLSRESGMDSRLSGGSTRSEIVTSSDKKKKSGLFGKLKKLARSRSTDRDRDSDGGSDAGSLGQLSDSGSLRLQSKPPTSQRKLK